MNDRSRPIRSLTLACMVVAAAVGSTVPRPASAASAAELARESGAALNQLYARTASARTVASRTRPHGIVSPLSSRVSYLLIRVIFDPWMPAPAMRPL